MKIKNKIDSQLAGYILDIDKLYSLSKISPLLFKNIRNFIRRDGKRIRPILFVIGYLGFAKKAAYGLYRSAVALEIFHDFMLVHDDIIDKSDTRRGKPSMHAALNRYLKDYKNIKFDGQDLSIVAGDVMYAMAIHAFLSVKEDMRRKEAALKKLIEAAIYTGSGEFIELLYGAKNIEEIKKSDIYKIYDLKTANYTFASPLSIGAILAGARKNQVEKLFKYGIYLGRAFQIKDDILGMFGVKAKIGKSNLTDLQEAKKTILIWYAYRNSKRKHKLAIKRILAKRNIYKKDLLRIRKIVLAAGALDYAKKEVHALIRKALAINKGSQMHLKYRQSLDSYAGKLLSL
ncbi:MAG: polyprenyl synthetase family protein [Candidatus Omnitrophica bacterium]|nr:polyprenyl synthetase family protein [Candidatus Omnitrophota bacterium]